MREYSAHFPSYRWSHECLQPGDAACLRPGNGRLAQALLPVLQGGAVALLVFTLSCIGAASIMLWRAGRNAVE